METAKLKKFAQFARRSLIEQVSAKLDLVLAEDSNARRESVDAIRKLGEAIKDHGKGQVIERVAYIWFNRFCALRFMDVNRYTRIGVVSPVEGQFQPEILAEAKLGHLDEEVVHEKIRQRILSLLNGKTPSRDPQGETYRLLLVAACNFWNKAMPFLFQRIDDYTELLLPDDLLSGNSIVAYTREAMTPDTCKDVEVIGWLYQYYISEKKEEVFAGLKKNKKITPENIPAATQLFTPHWIVRYLVENSLGRLWLLNRPNSKLIKQMDYYIRPEQPEMNFLRISKPEEIQICDPACGSGHMLTYAFDLLYAIYEEEGYDPAEIPEKILTNNLHGIEIDERAGELAAFALTMKARAQQHQFFNKKINPSICVLENVRFDEGELKNYMEFVGRDLFTATLESALLQFDEADNFGSLIRPEINDVQEMLRNLALTNVSGKLLLSMTHQKVQQALRQADYLSPKYHVVIANPPYMGIKGMNGVLVEWLKKHYQDSKVDLMTCFMDRATELTKQNGYWSMINLPSWMFLSSFKSLRKKLILDKTFLSLVHLGRGMFGSDFGSVAFVMKNGRPASNHIGIYRRLFEKHVQVRTPEKIEKLFLDSKYNHYLARQSWFSKVPSSPIAYWLSESILRAFENLPSLFSIAPTKQGLATGDNDRFLRFWSEPSFNQIGFDCKSSEETIHRAERWYPCNKGGEFRKWYGNNSVVVDWENAGERIKNFYGDNGRLRSRPQNESYYFKSGLTWSAISIASLSMRMSPNGAMFETKGAMCFPQKADIHSVLSFSNTKIVNRLLLALSPTLDFHEGPVGRLPYHQVQDSSLISVRCVQIAKWDWDSYETSWDFANLPLLNPIFRQPSIKATTEKVYAYQRDLTLEMHRLEEENNRNFIEAYSLQDELTPEVSLREITLTCNPHYRYSNNKSEDELEALLLTDTMRELVSYAVGCMFGRYALEKPGLILANQGESIADYLKQVPSSNFSADDDNVIPMLDGDWFPDDMSERFHQFLRVAFGADYYEENLLFVEQALNIKGKRSYSIRDYFLSEFYADHVKRYKKRPIYWMFSSPKGSFNALIYMHRYRPDTVSVVLNDYLREFRTKLSSRKNHLEAVSISDSSSQGERTKALKEIEKTNKMIAEMEEYERDVLYPLAIRQVEIDLDDGVKVNYPKFGKALKNVAGLST